MLKSTLYQRKNCENVFLGKKKNPRSLFLKKMSLISATSVNFQRQLNSIRIGNAKQLVKGKVKCLTTYKKSPFIMSQESNIIFLI